MPLPFSSSIIYLFPIEDDAPEQATPLQGFAPSLALGSPYLHAPFELPADVFDLSVARASQKARRACGINQIRWTPVSKNALFGEKWPTTAPFVVAFALPGYSTDEFMRWADKCRIPPTIVAPNGGHLSFDELTVRTLQTRLLAVCEALSVHFPHAVVQSVRQAIETWEIPAPHPVPFRVSEHASLLPNVRTLEAMGFEDVRDAKLNTINSSFEPYASWIAESAAFILEHRRNMNAGGLMENFHPFPELNLFAPAMYPEVQNMRPPTDTSVPDRRKWQSALNMLTRQSGYSYELRSPGQITTAGLRKDGDNIGITQEGAHPLLLTRQMELSLSTAAMCGLAASELSATLRLPNDINRTAGAVRQFAQHYRSRNQSERERVLAFRRIQNRLAQSVPESFMKLINDSNGGLRIVSNAHLEWLDTNGLPLLIQKDTSRIPVTPGNAFIGQVTSSEVIRLMPSDFYDILVIGALHEFDPIRRAFDVALETFGEQWNKAIRVRYTEVSTVDEFVDAVNSYTGPLLIFDGHGSHQTGAPAVLHIKDESVSVWDLKGRILRAPPIVVLSACDTHAADRNHSTTANGLLALGARAVLATTFPVNAIDAATFAARLIYRISDYIPAAVRTFDRALSWTEVISGLLRMQLATDFLLLLVQQNLLDEGKYREFGTHANYLINGNVAQPFERLIDRLQQAGIERPTLLSCLERAVATSSVIGYLNMGRPETILVDTEQRFEAERTRAQSNFTATQSN